MFLTVKRVHLLNHYHVKSIIHYRSHPDHWLGHQHFRLCRRRTYSYFAGYRGYRIPDGHYPEGLNCYGY